MGMLFQNGALLTDLSVFENVAFPLREHTDLTERLIRQLVFDQAASRGLRGAADLMPAELSGAWDGASPWRAPSSWIPRSSFMTSPSWVGSDFARRHPAAHPASERRAGSHQHRGIARRHRISSVADSVYLLSGGKVAAHGAPRDLQASSSPVVRQFIGGLPDGPVPFHFPAPDYFASCSPVARAIEPVTELWRSLIEALVALGDVSRFLLRLILATPRALLRFELIVRQIFNSGALSLVIIMLSGLFVGMVLGLQGFQLLQRFGSEEALGVAAAIGLVKELSR